MSLLSVVARLAFRAVGAKPEGASPTTTPPSSNGPALVSLGRDPDRHELKYWVPEARLPELIRFLEQHLVHDPNGVTGQINTSMYFDTPDLAFFRAHNESAPDRRKLRIRAYGDPPSGVAFFETKRKIKMVTVKTRASMPLSEVRSVLDGTYEALPEVKPKERRHLESFLFMRTVTHAEPLVLVRANRIAFSSPDPADDIRVTFDMGITFQRARGPTFDCDPNGWIPIDGEAQHGRQGPHVLLELKFPRIAPGWMRPLTEWLGTPRISYSKYMSAVRLLLAEEDTDRSLLDRCSTLPED